MAKRPKSKEFAGRLAEIMGERTQERFAAELGINRPQLARYLAGRIPDPEILKKISLVTGRSLDWLLLGREGAVLWKDLYDAAKEVRAINWKDPDWPKHYGKAHRLVETAERDVKFLERVLGVAEPTAQYGLPPEILSLIELWRALDEEGRATAQRCIQALSAGDADIRQHLIGQLKIIEETVRKRRQPGGRADPRPRKRTAAS